VGPRGRPPTPDAARGATASAASGAPPLTLPLPPPPLYRVTSTCLPLLPPADTEIDWRAYMQEVEGWVVRGDTDYLHLRGDTGPLVYPGGFMWLFRALRAATAGGTDIRAAQWVFLGVYLATQAVVLDLYGRARAGPPWAVVPLVLSKRLHSLFVLRLFNDCAAMLAAYVAMALFVRHKVSGVGGDGDQPRGASRSHAAGAGGCLRPWSTHPSLRPLPTPTHVSSRPPPARLSPPDSGSSGASRTPSRCPSR
jgi:hypothetical protein